MLYSKDQLNQFLDKMLSSNALPSNMVSQILGEREQKPVEFKTDTLETKDIPNLIEDGEVFTENPNYIEGTDFCIFNSEGDLVLKISPNGEFYGKITPDDREEFINFCYKLQEIKTVRYPKLV